MRRRTSLPPELLSADSQYLYDLLNEASDTSAIVVAVSYIDACLASVLAKHLLKSSITEKLLDSRSGAIGSFSARSDLAYALSLIDKSMYQDLLVLAELRNEAAHHHFALLFSSGAVIGHCERLRYVAGLKDGNTNQRLLEESWFTGARNRFVMTTIMIVNRLLLTALATSQA